MPLNPRERTIAIFAGGALGLGAFYTVLIQPLQNRLDAATVSIDKAREDGERAQQILEKRNRAARLWRDLTGDTLKADQQTAEGQLVNRVREIAQSSGLTLDSLKPDRSEKEKFFQRVSIRATATGTMGQVKSFLDALRTTNVPLRVTDVTLTSRKDGVDDIGLQLGLATIFTLPAPPAAANREGTR